MIAFEALQFDYRAIRFEILISKENSAINFDELLIHKHNKFYIHQKTVSHVVFIR